MFQMYSLAVACPLLFSLLSWLKKEKLVWYVVFGPFRELAVVYMLRICMVQTTWHSLHISSYFGFMVLLFIGLQGLQHWRTFWKLSTETFNSCTIILTDIPWYLEVKRETNTGDEQDFFEMLRRRVYKALRQAVYVAQDSKLHSTSWKSETVS